MKGKCHASRSSAFTLIELLVVIVIIGILAALLLPVLNIARERARQASCKSQLHQFAVALDVYRNNYPDYTPPWLSSLFPVYIAEEAVFLCPSDASRGTIGSRPDWFSDPMYNADRFDETDDTDLCAASDEVKNWRNPDIHACSYLYEFCAAECSWWSDTTQDSSGHVWADFDRNGFVSWAEAKRTEQKGLVFINGKIEVDETRIYFGHVPIIRCFWHARRGKSLHKEIVLNLAVEDKNVYESPVFAWEQTAQ